MLFKKSYFVVDWTDYEVRVLHVSHFRVNPIILGIKVFQRRDFSHLKKMIESFGVDVRAARLRVSVHVKAAYVFLKNLDKSLLNKKLTDLMDEEKAWFPEGVDGYQSVALDAKTGQMYVPNLGIQSVLFAGVKRTGWRDFLTFAEEAKYDSLELASINQVGASLQAVRSENLEGNALFINVGSENSLAWIVNKAEVLAVRGLSFGVKSWVSAVASSLKEESEVGLMDALQNESLLDLDVIGERLARDIESFIGFYELETGMRIQKMGIFMPHKIFEQFVSKVSHQIGVELFLWTVSDGFNFEHTADEALSQSLGLQLLPLFHLISDNGGQNV